MHRAGCKCWFWRVSPCGGSATQVPLIYYRVSIPFLFPLLQQSTVHILDYPVPLCLIEQKAGRKKESESRMATQSGPISVLPLSPVSDALCHFKVSALRALQFRLSSSSLFHWNISRQDNCFRSGPQSPPVALKGLLMKWNSDGRSQGDNISKE